MTKQKKPAAEFDRLLNQLQRNVERAADMWGPEAIEFGHDSRGSVRVDLENRPEELVLRADLPGFDRDDIDVRVTANRLTLSADRETETIGEQGEFLWQERSWESVARTVRLPESVSSDEVTAKFENGVLTVYMPKEMPESGGSSIEID